MTLEQLYAALESVFPPIIVPSAFGGFKSLEFNAWIDEDGQPQIFLSNPTPERLALAAQAIASLQEEEE